MTYLSSVQVADYWIGAGGPRSRAVEWVAIAMGESGLNDQALSPAGAISLWQIMPFNAPLYGYTASDLYDPAVNARVAVAMSGGGTNCAAWDSCYRDIYRSGRYSFLAWPETGSADYQNLSVAASELAGHGLGGISDPGMPGIDGTMQGGVSKIQNISGRLVPAVSLDTVRLTRQLQGTFKRGWRP